MRRFFVLLSAICTVACASTTQESTQVVVQPLTNSQIEKQVDELYQSMTMEERVAQLHGIRPTYLMEDGKLSLELCRELIPNGIGHFSQYSCSHDMVADELRDFVRDLQNYLINETRLGIPAIFHEEAITGFTARGATTYPQQIGVACTWNPDLVWLKSDQTRETMRSCGGVMALSPMVDVVRTQHFNRVEESYGEDGYLASSMAKAFIEGLQGDDLSQGVAACTKHFLGYGGGLDNSEKELFEEIIMPHEVGIRVAGSKSIMTSYGTYKGESTVASRELLQDILRDYLQFDGLAISDYGATASVWSGKGDPVQHLYNRAAAAMNAGNDLELSDGQCYPLLPQLVESGEVSAERFEEAVKRNLTMKARLGLLDENPKLYAEGEINLDKDSHRQTAYDIAAQSIVLIKNNGVLPLDSAKSKSVALVGPNANSFWCMLGDYTYQSMYSFWSQGEIDPNDPKIYNLKEGLDSRLDSSMELIYERGCDWTSAEENASLDKQGQGDPRVANLVLMLLASKDPTDWDRAMSISESSDVVIAAVGENPTLCGEGRSRKGIRLPGDQERFVEALIDQGKPVVVVIFGGRAQVLSDKILDGAAAIVQAWYPGEEGGNAVADILVGRVNPSGKLAVSYPATEAKENICYNKDLDGSELVAFPFGHGLSYTTFEYSDLQCTRSAEIGAEDVELTFTLSNSGDRFGSEVVQLYISPKGASDNHKAIQLKGYDRVDLDGGESQRVTMSFSPEILSYYDGGMWHSAAGEYIVKIGASSSDIRLTADLTLTGQLAPKVNRDIYFSHNK